MLYKTFDYLSTILIYGAISHYLCTQFKWEQTTFYVIWITSAAIDTLLAKKYGHLLYKDKDKDFELLKEMADDPDFTLMVSICFFAILTPFVIFSVYFCVGKF